MKEYIVKTVEQYNKEYKEALEVGEFKTETNKKSKYYIKDKNEKIIFENQKSIFGYIMQKKRGILYGR